MLGMTTKPIATSWMPQTRLIFPKEPTRHKKGKMYLTTFVTLLPKAYVKLLAAFHHCPIKVVKQKMSRANVPACFNGSQTVPKALRANTVAEWPECYISVTPTTKAVTLQMTMVSRKTSATPVIPSSTGCGTIEQP